MAETESTIGGLGKGEHSLSCSVQSERNTGKERVGRAILATFFAALGPLSFGYCLGYSSSALEDLANESTAVRLNDIQGSWFSVSLVWLDCVPYYFRWSWLFGDFGDFREQLRDQKTREKLFSRKFNPWTLTVDKSRSMEHSGICWNIKKLEATTAKQEEYKRRIRLYIKQCSGPWCQIRIVHVKVSFPVKSVSQRSWVRIPFRSRPFICESPGIFWDHVQRI